LAYNTLWGLAQCFYSFLAWSTCWWWSKRRRWRSNYWRWRSKCRRRWSKGWRKCFK